MRSKKSVMEKRTALWNHNLRYAILLTTQTFERRMPHHICTREDLDAAAFLALWEATETFDPTLSTKFISYAKWAINKSLSNALVNAASGYTVPRGALRILSALSKQETTGVKNKFFSAEQLRRAACYKTTMSSIDVSIPMGETFFKGSPHDLIQDKADPRKDLETPELALVLDSMINKLKGVDPRLPQMMRDYHGFNGEPKTLKAIGDPLGITRERVRQILFAGLRRLRVIAQTKKLKLQDLLP